MRIGAAGGIRKRRPLDDARETVGRCPSRRSTEKGTGFGLQHGDHVDGVQVPGILFPFRIGQPPFVGPLRQVVDTLLHGGVRPQVGDLSRHVGRETTGQRFQQPVKMDTRLEFYQQVNLDLEE